MPRVTDNANNRSVAAILLREGGVVAFPTDTVYGLAVLPTDTEAVARLFEAKKRHPNQSVPLHITSLTDAAAVAADVPDVAKRLMRAFWPDFRTLPSNTNWTFRVFPISRISTCFPLKVMPRCGPLHPSRGPWPGHR